MSHDLVRKHNSMNLQKYKLINLPTLYLMIDKTEPQR